MGALKTLEGTSHVLCDFGLVTRVADQVTRTNPGSITTRPPELFGRDVSSTKASDVYSLGASFMKLYLGVFPLIGNQKAPRKSEEDNRAAFESKVANLLHTHQEAVDERLEKTMHNSIRSLLANMLLSEADRRWTIAKVVRYLKNKESFQ